ncbi:uncharacterized protein [Spinacia oleracea]|uniref:Uncharacterized protein isoform X2 n=1 Tax=Spinacia oleracea TaxID=3562 RepID=A0ABM3RND3_SPIOL|nr:uncharacterized protein LOC130470635 isoform X2 [Spinacia oleracea]
MRIIAFDLALGTREWLPHLSLSLCMLTPRPTCVMGGCFSKRSSNSQNDLVIEILKRPGEVLSLCLSCALDWNDIQDLIGFTKTGKIFVVLGDRLKVGLVDPSSKQFFFITEGQGIVRIDSYVPNQILPHPPMDLQNARELEERQVA